MPGKPVVEKNNILRDQQEKIIWERQGSTRGVRIFKFKLGKLAEIDFQEQVHMIKNRRFEYLACL